MAVLGKLSQQLLLGIIILAASASASAQPLPSCNTTCGSLLIPYPFGTSKGCYIDRYFLITCDYKSDPPTPYLRLGKLVVLNISLDGELRIGNPVARSCYGKSSNISVYSRNTMSNITAGFWLSKFRISNKRNMITAVGCGVYAYIQGSEGNKSFTTGCLSLCDRSNASDVVNGSCSGIGCCQTSIPSGPTDYIMSVESLNSQEGCGFGFIVDKDNYTFSSLDLPDLQKRTSVPLVLDWAVGNETCEAAKQNMTSYACKAWHSYCINPTDGPGYRCTCSSGYQGNPYLPDGCQDIDECTQIPNPCYITTTCTNLPPGNFTCSCPKGFEGDGLIQGTGCSPKVGKSTDSKYAIPLSICIILLVLLVVGSLIYWERRRRELIKLKEKFFVQNGGLRLLQQLSTDKGSMEIAKIFRAEELEKATENYDESKVLGRGGYGTVYRGVLPDNKVVAIKKSKLNDPSQIEQFINEVIVLAQINHRNVVKLLGCCLETEVPLLVYEFITNGTLSEHIHDESKSCSLSWEKRLRIAAETAGAIAYLHSEASMPIIHRDVKTTNILLDENLIAKVSDFGASRLVPLDRTQLTTLVQGTLGYLDPEYFHTAQLTEKSDVYSFGVVVAELLTGKEALSFDGLESERSLAMYFVAAVKENRLLEILADHIKKEIKIEEVEEVAELAKRCLMVKREDRPTMREVAMELEGLRMMGKHPRGKADLDIEETEHLLSAPSAHSFIINAGNDSSSSSTAIGYESMSKQVLKPLDIDGR